jgi:hypothetical protein
MKKIFALLLVTLICFNVNAQNFYKVIKCSIHKHINGSWTEIQSNEPEEMYLIINDKNVKITNENHSEYQVYGDMDKQEFGTHDTYSWHAYDKNGKKCEFVMKYMIKEDIIQISFLYLDETVPVSFAYYVKTKK